MTALIAELRRRNMFRVASIYAVVGWLVMQLGVVLETTLNLPPWFDTIITVFVLLGFPVAMVLAWAFEITPDGVRPTPTTTGPRDALTARLAKLRLNTILGVALACAVGFIIYDKTLRSPAPTTAMQSDPAATASAATRTLSLAVLPFTDMSATGDQDWFGDGISEELLNLLVRVDGLRVASRTSSFTFRDQSAPISEIASALNVAHILQGSVRRSGDAIRITAQLIDVATDEPIWSDSFDRQLSAENLFAIQDEIANAILTELKGQLALPQREIVPTLSTRAYEDYLRGRASIERRTEDAINSGITDLTRAVTLDPDFALAHSKLALAYDLGRVYAKLDPEVANEKSDFHIQTALALDPDNPAIILDHAWTRYARQDVSIAAKAELFEEALRQNPVSADAHRGLSNMLAASGDMTGAQRLIDRAVKLDPRSVLVLMNAGERAMQMRDYASGRDYFERALALDPDTPLARQRLATIAYDEGRIPDMHRILKSGGAEAGLEATLADLYRELELWNAAETYEPSLTLGYKAAVSGDRAEALRYADLAETDAPLSAFSLRILINDAAGLRDAIESVPVVKSDLETLKTVDGPATAGRLLAYQIAYADAPQTARVTELLDGYYRALDPTTEVSAYNMDRAALWAALAGDRDQLYGWLDAAISSKAPVLYGLTHPAFDPYRDETRFQTLSTQLAKTVTDHSQAVASDLANPPAIWWEPPSN